MGAHGLFKELLSYYDELTKEEEMVLCIHCLLLESGLDNVWKESDSSDLPRNGQNIFSSEKYLKYGTDKSRDNFCICKILINPNWRKDKNSYTFSYKNVVDDTDYNLYILNVDKSLIVQLVNTKNLASLQSLPVEVDEYIQNEENSEINWTNINIPKLKSCLNENILNKFGLNKKINSDTNEVKASESLVEYDFNTSQGLIQAQAKAFGNKLQKTENTFGFYSDLENRLFDDKQPNISQHVNRMFKQFKNPFGIRPRGLFPERPEVFGSIPNGPFLNHISPNMLKPDGMLFGPNHQLFNRSNLRYDIMGPFGTEPNFDETLL